MKKYFSRSLFLFMGILLLSSCATEEKKVDAPPPTKEVEEVTTSPVTIKEDTVETSTAMKMEEPEEKEEVKEEKVKEELVKKKKKAKKRAKAKFENRTHEYGLIMQGDKIEHQFKFKNTGKADLVIKNVTASCGCTQPSYPFVSIAPGEEGFIGVIFDSKGKLGKQKPTITVVTNARPHTYKLYLDGYVDAQRADEVKESKEEEKGNR